MQYLIFSIQEEVIKDPRGNVIAGVALVKKPSGLMVTKIYTFHRNDYAVHVAYQVKNEYIQKWEGNLYTQLLRQNTHCEL